MKVFDVTYLFKYVNLKNVNMDFRCMLVHYFTLSTCGVLFALFLC